MTGKMNALARALAAGKDLKTAAQLSGYNLNYAKKKAREPAFQALVERLKTFEQARSAQEKSISARCWAIIDDLTASNSERVAAMRTLMAYDRENLKDQVLKPPIIIDDIELANKYHITVENSTEGQQNGSDRPGSSEDLPGSPAIPAEEG